MSAKEIVIPLELATCAVAADHSSCGQKVDVTFMEGAWGRHSCGMRGGDWILVIIFGRSGVRFSLTSFWTIPWASKVV